MNTIRSTWVGWGTLCAAGGTAYYLANKSITADRTARQHEAMRHKAKMATMEAEYKRTSANPGSTPSSANSARIPPTTTHPAKPTDDGGSSSHP